MINAIFAILEQILSIFCLVQAIILYASVTDGNYSQATFWLVFSIFFWLGSTYRAHKVGWEDKEVPQKKAG